MTKKILVTSALPYVNNIPHLGTLVCIINADIYTRFLRSKKYNVISVLGTDEHGSTTEVKAMQEGKSPQEITDYYYKLHKEIYEWFNTSFDCFGRTSSPQNHEITQEIFAELDANGYITSHKTNQLYDEKAKRFLPDRFVEGKCPQCGYESARGDQCDKCGSLLEPTDLINPMSTISGTAPISRTSTHLYIDLPKMQKMIEHYVEKNKQFWSQNARATTESWMKKGLLERCITRDLQWGVPVLKEGYTDKVFYSWFDAPIGYIGITKECRSDWKEWWQNSDVELVQFMGKDNIPFHTILFPAFLIGTKKPWTLLHTLAVNEFLNYQGGKFSKSRGVGVFGDGAKDSGIPADAYRYYITAILPDQQDTVFDWDDFGAKYNNELIANFANLVNRTLAFVAKFYDGKLPSTKVLPTPEQYEQIEKHYAAIDPKTALQSIMALSKHWNAYFQNNQPWKLVNEHPSSAADVIGALVHAIKDMAIVIEPIMPVTAASIREQLNVEALHWNDLGKALPHGHKIGQPKPLFEKLEAVKIAELKTKFAGQKQSDDTAKKVQEDSSPLNKLQLVVGKILSVEPHPNADKLFIERVDMGDHARQIVSGLKTHYKPDELVGKHIIVVANLKPANIRGVESQGMLLAAQGSDGSVGVLEAPHSAPGSVVYGAKHYVAAQQASIDDVLACKIVAKDNKVMVYKEILQTSSENISVDKAIDGPVR